MKTSQYITPGKNNVSYVGSQFKEIFYNMPLTEGIAEGMTTKKLPRQMNDQDIFKELNPSLVSLGDMMAFLKDADQNKWYIFYVKDGQDTLWAVDAYWYGDGWSFEASSVTDALEWGGGFYVVSRSFSQTPSVSKTLSPSDTMTLDEAIEVCRKAGLTATKIY